MARYTEYLFEYLNNGHTLPDIFDTVPPYGGADFKALFTNFYRWREIGFDTEARFSDELGALAAVVVPDFVDRIKADSNIDLSKTEYQNTDSTTIYAAPYGSADLSASMGTTVTTGKHGLQSVSESIKLQEHLQDDPTNLYTVLLMRFEKLFMGVY